MIINTFKKRGLSLAQSKLVDDGMTLSNIGKVGFDTVLMCEGVSLSQIG